jgi:hypothetical protein
MVDVSDTHLITFLHSFTSVFICFQITTTALGMNYHNLGFSVLVPTVICFMTVVLLVVQLCFLCHRRSYFCFDFCYKALDVAIIILGVAGVIFYLFCSKFLSDWINMMEKDRITFSTILFLALMDSVMLYYVGFIASLSIFRHLIYLLNNCCCVDSSSYEVHKMNWARFLKNTQSEVLWVGRQNIISIAKE